MTRLSATPLRTLSRTPGFTLSAVLTLALGIGANAAVFAVVHAVLLNPLPYRQPDRLVRIWETNPAQGIERGDVSPGPTWHGATAARRSTASRSILRRPVNGSSASVESPKL